MARLAGRRPAPRVPAAACLVWSRAGWANGTVCRRRAGGRAAHRAGPGPCSPPPPVATGSLAAVRAEFALDGPQTIALAVALAPELDTGYRSVFAHLNDDANRPLPSLELCARLAGDAGLLGADAPLLADGLVQVVPAGGATHWSAAGLLVAAPARDFLLGLSGPPVPPPGSAYDPAEHGELVRAARTGHLHVIAVEAPVRADAVDAARGLAAALGRPLVEAGAGPAGLTPEETLRAALVRARLHRALLLLPDPKPAALEMLSTAPVLTVVVVDPGRPWRRALEGVDHAVLTLTAPDAARRARLWRTHLRAYQADRDAREIASVADLFALCPTQIAHAAAAAGRDGVRPLAAHARDQSQALLPTLVQSLDPGYEWGDLVLPEPTLRRLRELASAIRHRHQVFDEWGFRRTSGGVASIRALFRGASGTGKTMSAAVVAADLGLPLCRVDLSAVVSKYIGETEKNLEEVFRAAEASSALLLFDEADALFGKRSAVTDARDRYANIEVAYLLQRLETYDGALILATNLAANLDEAFARRLQVVIEFPLPDVAARERLWRHALPAAAPVGERIDVAQLARMFPLSGGEIGNVALTAAFLASYAHTAIGMEHVIRAIARHRLRQGKLPGTAEFGPFLHLARAEGT
ncbi:ATP-binding protein [Flexivirga alba]|uniref:ATP-binding protein n=1 Tax=Flexivirga alba TaxID=702742 RepID=A0ABW2AG59_9MICO